MTVRGMVSQQLRAGVGRLWVRHDASFHEIDRTTALAAAIVIG
jgi:hypothetical protein